MLEDDTIPALPAAPFLLVMLTAGRAPTLLAVPLPLYMLAGASALLAACLKSSMLAESRATAALLAVS